MTHARLQTLMSAALLISLATGIAPAPAADRLDFRREVLPILSDRCFACHGPDAGNRKGDLRLDQREGLFSVLKAGNPAESDLVARIESKDADEVMPPPHLKKPLSNEEIATLKRWVQEGAAWSEHWAWQAPKQAPALNHGGVANPIDGFLNARLKRERVAATKEADRPTLIRRVAFTLTGLPPTVEEVDAFLADAKPGAYERMVDRYLSSPRFGEEFARHWLDLARYADTHGLHLDNERQMWAYRDWVVAAFNRNQPFDRFSTEQLAGDLLPNPTRDQLIATGFNRCNVTTSEGGSIDEEWIFRNAVDRTSTTYSVFLGLTGGCAVCHDHKFDPITARDFYSMYAFFHSAADPAMDGNVNLTAPIIKMENDEHVKRRNENAARRKTVERKMAETAAKLAYVDPADGPPQPPQDYEELWFDERLPKTVNVRKRPRAATKLVDKKDGEVHRGKKAIKRVETGLGQDVFDNVQPSIFIPSSAKIVAWVWLNPKNPPKSVMLQFFKGGWLHRAVWGDYNAINFGTPNTTEKVHMGSLPKPGEWTRLEVPAEKVGLKAGDSVTGFALTQFGGEVHWDDVGLHGKLSPTEDPRRSLDAWWKQQKGKDSLVADAELKTLLKSGPDPKATPAQRKKVRDYYLQYVWIESQPTFKPMVAQMAKLDAERNAIEQSIPGTFVFRDLPKPRESFVMVRGQYDKKGERVEPGVPAFLPPLKPAKEKKRLDRLDLARWLFDPEHPLTSRVAVNRFWQQAFGVGLVKSSADFGMQGEPPSHPELLDWLAVHFRQSGWNVKALVRLMLVSDAFRRSSQAPPEHWSRDPENRLLARGPRVRLDAEQIRDNAIFLSGRMVFAMGGKSDRPYQPENIWEPVGFLGSNTREYRQDRGDALYRRSLYAFLKRTAPPPFMVNFDGPNREASCTRRERSNTPLQALQLLNDVQHVEAARGLAERMLASPHDDADGRLTFAFRTALARAPDADELAILREGLKRHQQRYAADKASAGKLVRTGESKPAAGLDDAELAAYTLIANTILNLDETISRN
jgi:mono/diheme cytochrome c family protein